MAITLVGTVQTNADTTTGWVNGGLETELSYQGSGSYGGKAGSGTTRYFNTGTSRNFSIGGGNEGDHIIVILGSLTPGKLDTFVNGGLGIIAGNDTTNFGEWYVDGSDTKSPTTLFLPYIIDPQSDFDNVSGSFTLTGNPAQLNVCDTFGGRFDATSGIMGNFNNALVDQITIGTGLRGTGSSGTLDEWITADEGTLANRYGFLTTREGIIYFQGKMYFGSSSTSYDFNDTDKVIIFPDVAVSNTFYEIIVENASSSVIMNGFLIQAAGTPKVALTHIGGTWEINSSTIDGARVITGADANFIIDGTKITNSGQIDLNGMSITNSTITSSTASSALLVNAVSDLTNLSNLQFINNTSGHSIEITTPGTYTFDNFNFTGGGLSETTTADVYNNSGGAVTINLTNGSNTPTIRNSAGSTTTAEQTVTVQITVLDAITLSPIENARVLLEADTGGDLTAGVDIISGLTNSSGIISNTGFSFTNNQPVLGRVRKTNPFYKTGQIVGTITSNGFENTILLISDE